MRSTTNTLNQLGSPLGASRSWNRRLLLHHVPLAVTGVILFLLFMSYSPASPPPQLDMMGGSPFPQDAAPMDHGGAQGSGMTMGGGRVLTARLTTSTGYVATVFLGLTLLVGPANLLLRRRNPVSTPLTRDIGTWAAITSIVHVILGLLVHGNVSSVFNFVNYFFVEGVPRVNSFGLGNWTGLVALVIVTGLLALSNDRSLRELKARRWKSLQRLNYGLFVLVVLHAFFYGALLRVTSPFTLVLIFTVIAVFVGQAVGILLYGRRKVLAGGAHA